MNQLFRTFRLRLLPLFSGSAAGLLAVALLAVPVAGNAQETTSAIRGKVLDENSNPIGSALVVVEDTRSGSTRSYTSNDNGIFLATRLLPGGPYSVTVNDTVLLPAVA